MEQAKALDAAHVQATNQAAAIKASGAQQVKQLKAEIVKMQALYQTLQAEIRAERSAHESQQVLMYGVPATLTLPIFSYNQLTRSLSESERSTLQQKNATLQEVSGKSCILKETSSTCTMNLQNSGTPEGTRGALQEKESLNRRWESARARCHLECSSHRFAGTTNPHAQPHASGNPKVKSMCALFWQEDNADESEKFCKAEVEALEEALALSEEKLVVCKQERDRAQVSLVNESKEVDTLKRKLAKTEAAKARLKVIHLEV